MRFSCELVSCRCVTETYQRVGEGHQNTRSDSERTQTDRGACLDVSRAVNWVEGRGEDCVLYSSEGVGDMYGVELGGETITQNIRVGKHTDDPRAHAI